MIINAIRLNVIPGKREAAYTHLLKLAQIAKEETDTMARVAINVTGGPIYEVSFMAVHDSLAAMQQTNDALVQHKRFQAWFAQSTEFFTWAAASTQTYRALRPAKMPDGWTKKFFGVWVLNIIPGQLANGRSHLIHLAEHIEATYNVPTDVLQNEGALYIPITLSIPLTHWNSTRL